MKVLLLSRYHMLAASTRLRTFQYIPFLEQHKFDITFAPLTGSDYLEAYNQHNKRPISIVFRGYVRRLRYLLKARHYDLLWIEKELFPLLPAYFERLLNRLGIPYVVDYDDAVFHNYDMNERPFIRGLMHNKIDTVMKNASLIIAGNEYLAQRARQSGNNNVEILPTVIDINRYHVVNDYNTAPFVIGWIGSPSTAKYLQFIEPALRQIVDGQHVKLLLVGAGNIDLNVPYDVYDWSEDSEVELIRQMSVGIMPLDNTPWELGKCGYKLIQYMGCALPIIGTPVGVNKQIIQHNINGYHAQSIEEWVSAIQTIKDDATKQENFGQQGRISVENEYCLQVTAPRLLTMLESTIN